jgi:peptidoglycan/xylan/chitin deacetylase (PgdA/CDA1 family)
VWKGFIRKAAGTVRAPDGRYAIVAAATDAAGNRGKGRTHVVVDTKPPSFRWKDISPEPLRAAGLLHFRFRSVDRSGPLRLSFSVLDAVSRVRRVHGIVRRPGDREIDWYPRYAGGGILIPGLYRVVMTVTDQAGNRRVSHARPFRVLRPVHSSVWRRVDGAGRRVALTFDDCNDAGAWSRILSVLKANGVHATFFCIGANVARLPDLARRTVREGNAVGDHTWDHAYLPGLSESAIRSRLLPTQAVWWRVAHVTTAPFFRPPYGAYNGTVVQAAGSVGYLRTVDWDVDPRDWSRPGVSAIVSRVLGAIHPGSIVVMHVIGETAQALPTILRGLRNRRLVQSTLPQLFHAAGYH